MKIMRVWPLLHNNPNFFGGGSMKKVLALLCAGVMAGMMFGCNSNPLSSTTPTITIDNIGAIDVGTFKNVTGKVEASEAITAISYSIITAAGADVSSDQITVTGPSSSSTKTIEFKDANLISIIVKTAAVGGGYKLKISATAGSATGSGEFDFTVNGPTSTLTEKTVTMGAQGNTTDPSLLDVDAMATLSLNSTDQTAIANVDLIFFYSTAVSPAELRFVSPSVAAGTPFDTWTTKAASEFKKVASTDYDATTTQAQIDALWGSGAGQTRLAVTAGDVVVVKTSKAAYKIVKINSISSTDATASMSIKGKY
jgi:hypothetical protein